MGSRLSLSHLHGQGDDVRRLRGGGDGDSGSASKFSATSAMNFRRQVRRHRKADGPLQGMGYSSMSTSV